MHDEMEIGVFVMCDAVSVARYVVWRAHENGIPIYDFNLEKIMYYLQKEYLKTYRVPLFEDEIRVTNYGPYVPRVRMYYCGNGCLELPVKDTDYLFARANGPELKAFVDNCVDKLLKFEPRELVLMSINDSACKAAMSKIEKPEENPFSCFKSLPSRADDPVVTTGSILLFAMQEDQEEMA